jgi:hypothetical protein
MGRLLPGDFSEIVASRRLKSSRLAPGLYAPAKKV